jgi:plastocyanin
VVEQLAASYPDRFAAVTMHVNGDGYDTPWGQNRLDFFYLLGSAVPTFMVDGFWNCPIGDYQLCVQQQLATPTDVTIELSGDQVQGDLWTVNAHVCLEGGGSRPVRVRVAPTLENHPELPTYTTHLLMQDVLSTDVVLPGSGCEMVTTSVKFDPLSWANQSDIVIVAWAEAPATCGPATVYQAAVMRWPFPAGSQLAVIEVTPTEVELAPGESVQLTATGRDQSGAVYPLDDPTWSLGAGNGTGSLDPTSGATTTFTATGAGTRQILCRDGDVVGAAIAVITDAPVLTAITIDPASAEVDVGGQVAFGASGLDQYGEPFPLDEPTWSVSGTGDGSFDPAAGAATTFTATVPGSSIVSCTQGDVVGAASVEILGDSAELAAITVNPASAQLRVGDEVVFTAEGVDQYGRPHELEDPSWRLDGTAAGSFDPASGAATTTFTATGEGSGAVICTSGGIEGAAEVTIGPAGLPAPRKPGRRVTP